MRPTATTLHLIALVLTTSLSSFGQAAWHTDLDAAKAAGGLGATEYHVTLGEFELRRKQGNAQAAADAFKRVLRLTPERCDALDGLTRAYKQLKHEELKATRERLETQCKKKP